VPADYLEVAERDGLKTTSIGRWALDKYRSVAYYSRLFSTGMKDKWPVRVYIDLCAGSGFSQIEGTNSVYWGSPLLALGVPHPFDMYVLCERDAESLAALGARVSRSFGTAKVRFVGGDCNECVDQIISAIPRGRGVLSFCFADPFDLSLNFSTIRSLASGRMDFLFVLALHMDGNRNVAHYTSESNQKIDCFLGSADWRGRWKRAEIAGSAFPRFLAGEFSAEMEKLGYLPTPFHKMKQVRSDGNSPLYHLALFSKHKLALRFWDEVLEYSSDQRTLEF
jgi:three-Cys-motif partner protein